MTDAATITRRARVDFQPIGKRVDVPVGSTVLEAAQNAGIELVATCGGVGVCESCRVRLHSGELGPLSLTEEFELSDSERGDGVRLACQAQVQTDVRIDIPAASLATAQRLQLEGTTDRFDVDSGYRALDLTLNVPSLEDLRADDRRIREALADAGFPSVHMDVHAIAEASDRLRANGWKARFVIRSLNADRGEPKDGDGLTASEPAAPVELIAVRDEYAKVLGVAVDVGTTKVAAYLVDLLAGEVLARAGTPNPQISRGEDVVARIAYANRTGDSGARLQSALVDSLNATIVDLCRDAGVSIDDVYEIVAVGNTAMHHLLAGLPVRQLGESPYVPASSEPLSLRARDVGFKLGGAARLYLPPVIAGYVGSDHIAMLLAAEATVSDAAASGSTVSDAATSRATAVYVDIGTNTEITLTTGGRMLTCSCASGPAFEGAHIRDGMRASPGAIERVTSVDGELQFHVVGNAQPVGICGSGILDAIAVLRDEGVLDARGRLDGSQPHVRTGDAGSEYVLVDAHDSGNGRDVVITRSDVNEIQLAKGAIRAGIEILLHDARLSASDIDRFIVAGAFGTYLRIESAIRVGLFPNVPVDRVAQIGNAAGSGAIQMLLSAEKRRRGKSLPGQIEYVELTNHSRFQDKFLDGLFL